MTSDADQRDSQTAFTGRSHTAVSSSTRGGYARQSESNMADCLAWPASRTPDMPGMESVRRGKRGGYEEDRGTAREILPWATSPNVDAGFQRLPHQSIYAAPFGTDADMAYRRREEAGTADYLPANQMHRGDVPF